MYDLAIWQGIPIALQWRILRYGPVLRSDTG